MFELTEEQKQAEIKERINKAMELIKPILLDHMLELGAQLLNTRNALVAVPALTDTKYKVEKSPIQVV